MAGMTEESGECCTSSGVNTGVCRLRPFFGPEFVCGLPTAILKTVDTGDRMNRRYMFFYRLCVVETLSVIKTKTCGTGIERRKFTVLARLLRINVCAPI